jgi:C4-dicarboxylate-specific signal transduction histidine kinase
VFDPFFSTKPPGEGSGLGLAISYELVHEMGGSIRAANDPRGGALFEIVLPS